MSYTKYLTFLACITLYLLLVAGCGPAKVSLHGQPVTQQTFLTAALVIHEVEVGSVALGDFFISWHQRACGHLPDVARLTDTACLNASTALKMYATQYAPKVLRGLQGARDVLTVVILSPTETTQEHVQEALALLQVAFSAAYDFAYGQGFPAPLPPLTEKRTL